ncbi:MAG: branched-chain amino acid transporter permease [Candidatus Heteroscillospira sp.]|jgi:branched-subunit amino acid transport protein AzlD
MTLSPSHSLVIIGVCALCTFLLRALPFLLFGNRPVPGAVTYLGRVLPMAVMSVLVIYCLRSVSFSSAASWLPTLSGAAVTAGIHLWRRSTFLSICAGTLCYMLLIHAL